MKLVIEKEDVGLELDVNKLFDAFGRPERGVNVELSVASRDHEEHLKEQRKVVSLAKPGKKRGRKPKGQPNNSEHAQFLNATPQ